MSVRAVAIKELAEHERHVFRRLGCQTGRNSLAQRRMRRSNHRRRWKIGTSAGPDQVFRNSHSLGQDPGNDRIVDVAITAVLE